jgi:hypothetical protein
MGKGPNAGPFLLALRRMKAACIGNYPAGRLVIVLVKEHGRPYDTVEAACGLVGDFNLLAKPTGQIARATVLANPCAF